MPRSTIDITGIDKRKLLAATWENAMVAPYYALTGTIPPDFEQPLKPVEEMGYIEYYRGRPIKSDLSGFEISTAPGVGYDSCNPVQPLATVVARLKGADAKVGDATFPDARASTENTTTVSRWLVRTRAPGGGHCALCQYSDNRPGWRHDFYFNHALLTSKTLHACADCDRIFRDNVSYLASKCRLC